MSTAIAGYSSEIDTAKKLDRAVRTLRLWRQRREGPPWTKFGKLIWYRDQAIEEWLRSLEQGPAARGRSRA
jgi:hypothetical protein